MDLKLMVTAWKIRPCIKAWNSNVSPPAVYFCFLYLKKKINQTAEFGKVFVYHLDLELARNVKSAVAHSASADITVLPWFI